MKNLIKSLLLLSVLFFLNACYNDNVQKLYPQRSLSNCDTINVNYTATIQPIFSRSCALSGCHTGYYSAGGWSFDSYQLSVAVAKSGRLIGSLKHDDGFRPMPLSNTVLSFCEIVKIQSWINAGMPQ
ncbi:MAG: hypothetical protein JSS78_05780 [Bacteroidetes bacterium]|nr:hypothetical protein [Bacteroidota bacterium]